VGVEMPRRDDANTIAEMIKPITPAIIKMTPIVESRIPLFWTAAELCAVTPQYMIAPATVDIALITIPNNPMIILAFSFAIENYRRRNAHGEPRLLPILKLLFRDGK
jgi:hypothetical protein